MSEVHSTDRARRLHHFEPPAPRQKPAKPSHDFPLFAHANGTWAKKIRGKLYYFGPWEDAEAALAKYLAEKDALHAGLKPRDTDEAATVKDCANALLNHRQALVKNGELSPLTWAEYKTAADLVVASFGKGRLASDLRAEDFAALRVKMAGKWGLYRLRKMIQYVKSLFKHAYQAGLLEQPMRFGPGFEPPSRKAFRLERAKAGPRLFTAEEVRRMIGAASVQVRAMILLGINCGFGNGDCGTLPLRALDLDAGVIDYPRPKTGMPRRCVLWPETVQALRDALAHRREPKDPRHAGLVFITSQGGSWSKDTTDSPLSLQTRRLLKRLGINGRHRLGFYTLRHTFRTVADGAKDQPATDHVMGHEVPHMSAVYREAIGDDRLRAVAEHVRAWLFPSATEVL
jgi:integrase